jgi:hypothetical protein
VLDFVAFIRDFGWVQGAMVAGLMLLAIILWRDLKGLASEYKLAIKRIEILEQSVKDADKVICRAECINLLKSIDSNVKKFI